MPVNDIGSARIDVRMWRKNGPLVDFHLILEVESWMEWTWEKVLRVDICHGHAHAHRIVDGQDSEEEPVHVCRIDTVDEVQAAYTSATNYCIEQASILTEGE